MVLVTWSAFLIPMVYKTVTSTVASSATQRTFSELHSQAQARLLCADTLIIAAFTLMHRLTSHTSIAFAMVHMQHR